MWPANYFHSFCFFCSFYLRSTGNLGQYTSFLSSLFMQRTTFPTGPTTFKVGKIEARLNITPPNRTTFALIFYNHGISDIISAAQIGYVFAPRDYIDTGNISLVYKVLLEIWIMKFFINFSAPKITCKLHVSFFTIEMLDGFWFGFASLYWDSLLWNQVIHN